MSVLNKFLDGFWFRTSRPSFQEGERISAYMTGYSEESRQGVIRVGDTVITVRDASPEQVGQLVMVDIQSFYESEHRGTATFVEESGAE